MTYVPPTLFASASTSIEVLRDRHHGQVAYIVGKGPSLRDLTVTDFGTGFVVVINDAVEVVQRLGLPMSIYSMQRDGCEVEDPDNTPRPCGTCQPLGWIRDPLIDPFPGINVVFSQYLSSWCLHGRGNRYVIPHGFFSLDPFNMSVLEAIPFSLYLGASSLVMMCFDPLAGADNIYDPEGRYDTAQRARIRRNLEYVQPLMVEALAGVPHSFYRPGIGVAP